MNMCKILVIDDDRMIRQIVSSGLSQDPSLEILTAADGDEGLEIVRRKSPSVVLLDVFLPEHHGLELFRKIRAIDHKVPIIFITADTSSETAIQAMSAGAFDYVAKPLNVEQLRQLTACAIRARQSMDEPVAFNLGEGIDKIDRFVGCSAAIIEVYKAIGRVAAQSVTVLIRGESGCGKELVARALFQNSDRRDKPYVAVNCAAIPDQLLESELFGHEKGAFTGAEKRRIGRFEQCDGGTLFLDEIGDMSPLIQGKVLRILQEQRFERIGGNTEVATDVRIIVATNRPLEKMVEDKTFREDLLYRLNGFTIDIPPLRERVEDIPLLLEYFLRRAKHDMKRTELEGLSQEAFQMLQEYNWPGNIRQLQSVVRQSVLSSTGTVIDAGNLPSLIRDCRRDWAPCKTSFSFKNAEQPMVDSNIANPPKLSADSELLSPAEPTRSRNSETNPSVQTALNDFIDDRVDDSTSNLYAETITYFERFLFARVLEITHGNQSRAAEILGITRGKVRDRIASFGIQFDKSVSMASSEDSATAKTSPS